MSDIDSLTEKQAEALQLVCQHHQTKEIARKLGISPRSVDQRLDGARQKLGAATRIEAARIYAAQLAIPYRIPGEPFPVHQSPLPDPEATTPSDVARFEDSYAFDERAPWDGSQAWRFPELRPRDLGAVARLAIMVGMAILLLVLVMLGLDLSRSLGLLFSG